VFYESGIDVLNSQKQPSFHDNCSGKTLGSKSINIVSSRKINFVRPVLKAF